MSSVFFWLAVAFSSTGLLLFASIAITYGNFINHAKMNAVHFQNNEKFFNSYKIDERMNKYWNFHYIMLIILISLQFIFNVFAICLASVYFLKDFLGTNTDKGITRITNLLIIIALILMNGYFSYLLFKNFIVVARVWHKTMRAWEIIDITEEHKDLADYFYSKISTKEFPKKMKLDKLIIKNRATTLSYRLPNFTKLYKNAILPKWFKEGKVLYYALFDTQYVNVDSMHVDDTNVVESLYQLIKKFY
ncbi:hypothetical protein [Mycoplasma sp. 2248]|uniref:hypothetical protein n=1 Tax=Mycoplasma sp. 2248 TaxID=3108528 RepID=UPI002B1D2F28|nr:hypothetical protein [Mycoplasma sp. 2248]MEA4191102.1 hypothetical protein [Mycoplasma sp. 2248]